MAKLAVAVTVFFFLIALSRARFPFLVDLKEEDVKNNEQSTVTTESNPKRNSNLIFLPSEKAESKSEEIDTKKPEPDSSKTAATNPFEPVTVINFRPITRQLPRHPSIVFRHRRPCRHHGMRSPWIMGRPGRIGSTSENRVVSYGNDMLTMSDIASDKKVATEKKPEQPKWFRNNEMRHIPAKWVHFHDADADQVPFKIEDVQAMMKKDEDWMKPRHDHHGHLHHHHHHHHHGEEEEEMKEGHEHENVLMKKIRKFLTHF